MDKTDHHGEITSKIVFNEEILFNIFKYFDLIELSKLSIVNKDFFEIVESENNLALESLKLPLKLQDYEVSSYSWFFNKLKKSNVKSIDITDCISTEVAKRIFECLQERLDEVQCLKIPLALFCSIENIEEYKNLKRLSVLNTHFFNCGVNESMKLAENVLKLRNLTHLNFDNIRYLNGGFLSELSSPGMIEIDFIECADFKVDEMEGFLLKNKSTLRILRIDGENTSEAILVKCLKQLRLLKELYICYATGFTNQLLIELASLAKEFDGLQYEKLILRKFNLIQQEDIELFFKSTSFPKLKELNFYDCAKMSTKCLTLLAETACNLEVLDVSWSEKVENEGLRCIFNKCPNMRVLTAQGCKLLNDGMFLDILKNKDSEGKPKIIRYINRMDFTKCDYISDKVLIELSGLYPKSTFINYYGDEFCNKMKIYKD